MAKRDGGTTRTKGVTPTADASGGATSDAMEQRVVAFAEQLGRIAGTLQAKAEGWMEREALKKQIASVRDAAADLLEQLAGSVARPTDPRANIADSQAAKLRTARTMVKTRRLRGRG